jgi:sterol desaturase/sphingolipid hydroxylase (fatty acid hydroxylase superfamily)
LTFALVSTTQVALSLLLLPLLYAVWPYRLQTLSMQSPLHWIGAWVLTDFAYYWIHRMLHATRLGWALHAPHHSARQLSLVDSLRTSWGEQPVGILAYGVPLVLLGVPPYIAGIFYFFVAIFQFCVHTEMDWSLGPLNGLLYTPAAHRSHHSRARAEADRNYGGFFVIFDRLFGTWQPNPPGYRPEAYGLPDWEPEGLKEVAFGELLRFLRGVRDTEGAWAKVRYALTREPEAREAGSQEIR